MTSRIMSCNVYVTVFTRWQVELWAAMYTWLCLHDGK